MRLVVVAGPKPIITPADIPGEHDGDDPFVAAMIASAQAEIDGPTGWLGRALGEQVIELATDCWPAFLPYRPVVAVESVSVDGIAVEDIQVGWDGVLVAPNHPPRGHVVIRYRAGYVSGKTGEVPASAKAAVILSTQLLRSMSEEDAFLQQEQITGIGSRTRAVTAQVADNLRRAVGSLLAPLQVYG